MSVPKRTEDYLELSMEMVELLRLRNEILVNRISHLEKVNQEQRETINELIKRIMKYMKL